MDASITAGILLVVGGLAWIGRNADDGKAELERAIADLSTVPAPGSAALWSRGANACARDSFDGDAEPEGFADYRWEKGVLTASNLDTLHDYYFPAWREQGWTDSADAPGVLQRQYGDYTVRVHIQEWDTSPGFSITARIAEPIC